MNVFVWVCVCTFAHAGQLYTSDSILATLFEPTDPADIQRVAKRFEELRVVNPNPNPNPKPHPKADAPPPVAAASLSSPTLATSPPPSNASLAASSPAPTKDDPKRKTMKGSFIGIFTRAKDKDETSKPKGGSLIQRPVSGAAAPVESAPKEKVRSYSMHTRVIVVTH